MNFIIQILTIFVCGYLWHQGGQGKKWERAFAYPVFLALVKANLTHNINDLLYAPCLWVMLDGVSYGVSAPPHRFWVWVFGQGSDGNYEPVEIMTRLTCGVFWSLAAIVLAIAGDRSIFSLYIVVCSMLVTIFGRQRKVAVSEYGTGASVALSIFI